MDIDKKILEIYDEISKSQKSILQSIEINEAAALVPPLDKMNVSSGFGPRWGRQHTGVDLDANASNVKTVADGVVEIAAMNNDDCGGTIKIKHADGYHSGYCHIQKINVRPGQTVRQGDVIGISGGGSNDPGKGNSTGPHLHFSLRKNGTLVNPMDYIGKEGILSPLSTVSSTDSSNSSDTEDAYDYETRDKKLGPTEYAPLVGNLKSIEGLYENRNLGINTSNRYGRIIIPKDGNPKIKSPISGKINNRKFFSGCVNQTTIENNDSETIYLQYCGISSPSLSNGDIVSIGDVLGNTDADVEVTMYDHKWSRIPITFENIKTIGKEVEKDNEKKKVSSEPEYWDPFMAALLKAPLSLFQDKYKDGNRTEKRFGGVADKKQVDPFVLNFLKDPFNRKKVNENIERIKKML